MNELRLDDLASGEPAPGGGAAAAHLLAIGAALAAMACRVTLARGGGPEQAGLRDLLNAAEEARREASALAAADSEAYRAVATCRSLPRGSVSEAQARSARLQEALRHATDLPLQVLALSVRLAGMFPRVQQLARPAVAADLLVGAMAVRAGAEAAHVTVSFNLAELADADYAARASADANTAARQAVTQLVGLISKGQRRP